MATQTIAWDDGTTDKVYISYTGEIGNSVMTISGDENKTGNRRSRIITLKTLDDITLDTLEVSQPPRSRAFNVSYNKSYQ